MSYGSDLTGRPRTTNLNRWWLVAVVVIIAMLAALLAAILFRGEAPAPGGNAAGPTAQPATPATTAAATTPSPPPSSSAAGGCSLPAQDQQVPTRAPAGVTWRIVNTIAIPSSSTAGPGVVEGPVQRCFARTPTGALIAASVLTVTTDAPGADQVLRRQVLPGPGRNAKLEQVQATPPPPKQPGETGVFAGFRFIAYTPDQATVMLAFTFNRRFFVQTQTVQWVDGDWKLNMDPPGGLLPGQPLGSLEGYVQWGAV